MEEGGCDEDENGVIIIFTIIFIMVIMMDKPQLEKWNSPFQIERAASSQLNDKVNLNLVYLIQFLSNMLKLFNAIQFSYNVQQPMIPSYS